MRVRDTGYIVDMLADDRHQMISIAAVDLDDEIGVAGGGDQVADFRQFGNCLGNLIQKTRLD